MATEGPAVHNTAPQWQEARATGACTPQSLNCSHGIAACSFDKRTMSCEGMLQFAASHTDMCVCLACLLVAHDVGAHCVVAEASVRINHLEEAVTKLRTDEMLTQTALSLLTTAALFAVCTYYCGKGCVSVCICTRRHAGV
eukprot:scaffold136143_cov20-Tisochrysis_lutea.AAC.1